MAVRTSRLAHMLLIRSLILRLQKSGYKHLRADLQGLKRPETISGNPLDETYVPDVTGYGLEENIFEVETPDTIYDEHTEKQWTSFAEYAKKRNGKFWVVVPRGAGEDAQSRLHRLNLSGRVLEL